MSRILLIEDDAAVRGSLSEILKSEGYEVTTRKDGRGFSQLLTRRAFDVIITDLKLPGIDGIDLIRKIRKRPLDSEIIIITGYGTMESAINAFELGVYDYITKPFEPTVIMNTVRRAIEKVELRRQKAKAEELIRSLKDFNEEILESSPQAIIVLDRDIVCRYWNSAAERLSGIEGEKLLGKDLIREKVWVLGASLPKQFQVVLNGNIAERTIRVTSPRRKDLTLRQKLSPLRDSEGKVKGILVFLTDVTQVKALEIRKGNLKRQRDLDLIRIKCLHDIRRDSETAQDFGAFFDSSLGHIVDALGHSKGVKAWITFDGTVYGAAEPGPPGKVFSAEMETSVLGKGELRVCAEGKGLSAREEDLLKAVAKLIGEVISRREVAGQALQLRCMEGLGRLAGGMAHNLNNILGGILGYTSFIKSEIPDDSPLHSYLRTIEESSNLAADITNQLLEVSGGPTTEIRPMNINENVERIIGLMRIFFDRNVIISSKLEPGLSRIKGDGCRLDRVMMGICLNAREAMQGGGRLTIETSNVKIKKGDRAAGLKPGRYVLITFSDTGVGMNEEAVQRCFDPFYSTKGLGYGLGLSSAYGVIRGHGGHIQVSSKPGSGTKMSVYLPALAATAKGKRRPADSAKGGTVLVVDDEELIRKMASDVLGKLGYRVIVADDGEEAISILRERVKEIDAVLLDLVMPGMDYRRVCKEVRKAGGGARIILSSGYRLPVDAGKMVSEGAALFIQKPYKLKELSSVMQKALEPRGKGSASSGKRKKRQPGRP